MKKRFIVLGLVLIQLFVLINIGNGGENNYGKIIYEDNSGRSLYVQSLSDILEQDQTAESTNKDIVIQFDYSYSINTNELRYSNVDADETLKQIRSSGRKYHTEKNNQIVSMLNINPSYDYFVSEYAPFMIVELDEYDNDEIYELAINVAEYSIVKHVYIREEKSMEQVVGNLTTAESAINLDDLNINYPNLTGDGVKIGILDVGIIDKNDENFDDLEYAPVIRNLLFYNETVEEHSTIVAAIAAGNEGIAPEARIYSVQADYNSNAYEGEVEWLLGKGVNVINMSFARQVVCTQSGATTRTSDDAYFSYITETESVVFVAASGNNLDLRGEGWVCSPSSSPDVISVGSVTDSGIPSYYSNYKKVEDIFSNPMIVAPGEAIVVPGHSAQSGTSLSTPIVSGVIALMMQDDPSLKIVPTQVMAKLIAGANNDAVSHISRTETTYEYTIVNNQIVRDYNSGISETFTNTIMLSGLYERTGAGMVDVNNIFDSYYYYESGVCAINPGSSSGTTLSTYRWVSSSRTIYVGLAYYVPGTETTLGDMANYNIEILDAYGNIVASTSSSKSNFERLEYSPTVYGKYTIRIWYVGGTSNSSMETINFSVYIN